MQDHAPGLEQAFALPPREDAYRITEIEGELPPFLRGTYYLNGPARFERGGRRHRHWLDGDGMVSALRFAERRVDFTHRFVRSSKWVAEEEAGEFLYRAFGSAFDGDRLLHGMALESPVNVSAYAFAGRLLAFGEQGLPWELDPQTLETRGLYTFGGKLNPLSPLAAHPHLHPETGEMVDFGISFSPTRPNLQIYRFAADGTLLSRRRHPLPAPISVHDFSLSRKHATFYLSPYVLDAAALAEEGKTLLEALAWRPELGSRLWILDHPSGDVRADVALDDGGYCLHLINSFEDGEHLVVDVLELDRPVYDQYLLEALFTDVRFARPRRYVIDLEAAEIVRTVDFADAWMADFPAVDPRRAARACDQFWMLAISASAAPGRKFFDLLVRGDWREGRATDVFRAEPGHYFGGEPVFLPDPASADGGWVLCQDFAPGTHPETARGAFLLFDAQDLAAGPRAALHLRAPIPLGFHASFAPNS